MWWRPIPVTIDSFCTVTEIFYSMDAYPPLKALLAFDAAMRHHSFAIAARDLAVTPGAIGQQIRNLEDWLGTPLFVRTVRQVAPTEQAVRYWADIAPALARIHGASHALRNTQSDEVWLSMPPTLAARWFARRMGAFMAQHPRIVLRLGASTGLADLSGEKADLAIRYFDGSDPALAIALLRRDEARLYCAPAYASRLKLVVPDDLVRATLLDSTMHPHWPAWLAAFTGLDAAQAAALPVQHVDMSLVAIEAARQGQGVVLTSALLVEEEVAAGTLVEPFPFRLPLAHAYYVVHQRGMALHPAARAVADWLLTIS